jgi:CDP-glucose 4,6-dehydratase
MNIQGSSPLKGLDGPILITGHTGFKGAWLTRYLIQLGINVAGFSLPPDRNDLFARAGLEGQIEEQFDDIRNYAALDIFVKKIKPAAIFHLAAQPLVTESYLSPLSTFETNVMGTANLLEVARTSDSVRAVIVVTTDKVYQNLNTGKRFVETDALLGADPYSASKVGAENVVIAWRNLPTNNTGLTISVVRSGNVIGGGDASKDRLMADVVRSHISGQKLYIRNPQSTRPWQHVLDPLHGYILALERAVDTSHGENFNFGPTEPALTVEEVIRIVQNSWADVEFEASESRTGNYESQLLDLDSSRARHVLSWTPKYSQTEAITKTIQWWKATLSKEQSAKYAIDKQISEFLE